MKKGQGIAVSSAILLIAATTFSFPIQKKNGFPFRMLPHPAMIAHAPKAAGGEVTHLVLDSAVDEGDGSTDVLKVFYNEMGQLDSVIEKTDEFENRMLLFHNVNDNKDSVLSELIVKGKVSAGSIHVYPSPFLNYYPFFFDLFSGGKGIGNYPDFSDLISKTASYCSRWDSINQVWHKDYKDTLIHINDFIKMYRKYTWDTAIGNWQLFLDDSLTIANGKVIQVVVNYNFLSPPFRPKFTLLYDEEGFIIEFNKYYWDSLWVLSYGGKNVNAYNDQGLLISSKMQTWDLNYERWSSLDSGFYVYYSYSYDSSGNISIRTDSIFDDWFFEPSRITHHFQYRTFASPVHPRPSSKPQTTLPFSVLTDGTIRGITPRKEYLSATLYTLSGRSICRIPLHSDLRLNDYCAQKGIHPGNGVCLLRIKSEKTGLPIGEWKVFLR